MSRVSSYAAKTHLPRLIANVRHGMSYTITKHNEDVAMLVPIVKAHLPVVDAIAGLKKLRQKNSMTFAEIQQLRAEGRK